MLEQGNVRENSDGGCGKMAKGQTEPSSGGRFPPLFPSGLPELSNFFWEKRMIRGIGNVLLSTYSQTSNGQNPMVTLGQPLVQMITPRGPILVSRKLAMKEEPNIELRFSRHDQKH